MSPCLLIKKEYFDPLYALTSLILLVLDCMDVEALPSNPTFRTKKMSNKKDICMFSIIR